MLEKCTSYPSHQIGKEERREGGGGGEGKGGVGRGEGGEGERTPIYIDGVHEVEMERLFY